MPKSRGRRKPKSRSHDSSKPHLKKRGEPVSSAANSYQRSRRRVRPEWHRPAGITVVVFGAVVILVNYAEHMEINWMPGGHKEVYFFLGIAIAALGAWFLSAFDRPA